MPTDSLSRPDFRLIAALAAAKLSGEAIRRLGRGGGTAAPGLIADRLDPRLLGKITARLPQGSIVVAGTNGKTTTSRMIADILEASGRSVAHNRSGSNLVRGVASALAAQSTITGDPRADCGVIESDEAALPEILRQVQPRVLVLNNLFRDQLDRYGELAAIANRWRPALQRLGPETTVIVNADDPTLAAITEGIEAPRLLFGLDDPDPRYQLDRLPHAVDATVCRECGADLVYDALYSAHLGAWRCSACGNARPPLEVAGTAIALDGVDALQVTVRIGNNESDTRDLPLSVAVPGLYNVYNTVAACAAALAFGIADTIIAGALGVFQSAFGRIERVTVEGRTLTMALVKNPVGFNETLRMLVAESGGLQVPTLIAINDLFADGRDVSWLWDVDFEILASGDAPLSTTGLRGADMANRLKYAGVPSGRIHPLDSDLAAGLDAFVASLPPDGTGYILPTYTAMLGLREILAGRGALAQFWKQ
jgi:lipid II isoglutaminyl synthase (glutamine-hydrolysing)